MTHAPRPGGRPTPRAADVRLVALDLDGTVCLPGGRLGPRASEVLRALTARGVQVVFATGRSSVSIRRLHAELGFTAPAVSLNGSIVTDPDGGIWQHRPLSAAVAAEVRALLGALAVGHVHLETLYCPPAHAWLAQALEVFDFHAEDGAGGPGPGEATMLFAVGDAEAARAASAAVRARLAGEVSIFEYASSRGEHHFLEVRSPGVDKGAGLRLVRERLGVPREATMAIGDWLNDLPLLMEAGWGVAMLHAPAALKNVADAVTTATNHGEGAAELLAKLFEL